MRTPTCREVDPEDPRASDGTGEVREARSGSLSLRLIETSGNIRGVSGVHTKALNHRSRSTTPSLVHSTGGRAGCRRSLGVLSTEQTRSPSTPSFRPQSSVPRRTVPSRDSSAHANPLPTPDPPSPGPAEDDDGGFRSWLRDATAPGRGGYGRATPQSRDGRDGREPQTGLRTASGVVGVLRPLGTRGTHVGGPRCTPTPAAPSSETTSVARRVTRRAPTSRPTTGTASV